MTKITNLKEDITLEENNQIFNKDKIILKNSEILFKGKNNILYFEKGIILENTKIIFNGNNSLVYLSKSQKPYKIMLSINTNNVFYIGKNNFINSQIKCILSEEKNIIIGDDCAFSHNIWLRTADPHLIYNSNTQKRTNYSRSIYIGDHVWIGQDVIILKGAIIGSGSIIAARSVATSGKIQSNSVFGGSPAKPLKYNVFWDKKSVHNWTKKDTQKYQIENTKDFIYRKDTFNNFYTNLEHNLNYIESPLQKLDFMKKQLASNNNKNRFTILPSKNYLQRIIKKISQIIQI